MGVWFKISMHIVQIPTISLTYRQGKGVAFTWRQYQSVSEMRYNCLLAPCFHVYRVVMFTWSVYSTSAESQRGEDIDCFLYMDVISLFSVSLWCYLHHVTLNYLCFICDPEPQTTCKVNPWSIWSFIFTEFISLALKWYIVVSSPFIRHLEVDLRLIESWASLNPKCNFHTHFWLEAQNHICQLYELALYTITYEKIISVYWRMSLEE